METSIKPLVLIVDDTPQNIQVLANILYEKGYSITIATSGDQALQSVKTNVPDLILLDIQMPLMDGYEVCKELKLNFATRDIPVIFLTAKIETEDILRGFEIGAVDYILKPFNIPELTARVTTHIELKRSKEIITAEKEKVEALNLKLISAYINIKDSIDYAKLIQEGMLPDLDLLQTMNIHHLLIYKPRNIVSGDFYKIEYINEKLFIVVADCVGHGVSGALLSMSGHNLLNEIINNEKIFDPAEILNTLNDKVRRIFKQDLININVGMDLAVCVIDLNSKTLEFAGANIPLSYFNNSMLKKLLPDKFAIGGDYLDKNKPIFSKQFLKFNSGDRFFLFTDGVIDQFNNADKEKITRRGFEQHLLLYLDNPFNSIKNDLLEFLKTWQGCNQQTDDILILGFEMP